MTREQAQQLDANPVWKGYMAGKSIEFLSAGVWHPVDMLSTNVLVTYPERYRLKPEPRRFWINLYGERDRALHDSREEANKYARQLERKECIEVVEVLPQPASQPPAEPQPARSAREWHDVLAITVRRWAVVDAAGYYITSCPSKQDAEKFVTDAYCYVVELTGTYTPNPTKP